MKKSHIRTREDAYIQGVAHGEGWAHEMVDGPIDTILAGLAHDYLTEDMRAALARLEAFRAESE